MRTGVNRTVLQHYSYAVTFILALFYRLRLHLITANVTIAQLKIHKHDRGDGQQKVAQGAAGLETIKSENRG